MVRPVLVTTHMGNRQVYSIWLTRHFVHLIEKSDTPSIPSRRTMRGLNRSRGSSELINLRGVPFGLPVPLATVPRNCRSICGEAKSTSPRLLPCRRCEGRASVRPAARRSMSWRRWSDRRVQSTCCLHHKAYGSLWRFAGRLGAHRQQCRLGGCHAPHDLPLVRVSRWRPRLHRKHDRRSARTVTSCYVHPPDSVSVAAADKVARSSIRK